MPPRRRPRRVLLRVLVAALALDAAALASLGHAAYEREAAHA